MKRFKNTQKKIQKNDQGNDQGNEKEIEIDESTFFDFINTFSSAETRAVYLVGDIDEINIFSLIRQIHALEKKTPKLDITIYINSDGGVVHDCLALIDVMNSSPCDIVTYTLGRAASAACLIASNGTPGKRYAGKNAEFMFHEIYGDVSALKYSDIPYYKEMFKRQTKTISRIFSRNTGKSQKEIKATFMKDNLDKWMSAMEAKKFGIVDKVIVGKRKVG